MTHNHGSEYQVKVIHEDGTEVFSEWIAQESIAYTMAALRKPQAKAYWLRERNVKVPFCALCQETETSVTEYPVTDHLSARSHVHDSSFLALTGVKDPCDLPVSAVVPRAAEPSLPPSRDVASVTEQMGGLSETRKLPSKKRTLRRIPPHRVLSRGGSEQIDSVEPKSESGGSKTP